MCAPQICSVLMPALSGVQRQRLDSDCPMVPTRWIISEIDAITWHELLRSFIGVYELRICGVSSQELARALQADEVGLDLGLLPGLKENVPQFYEAPFDLFICTRQIVGHPVHLR